MVYGLASCQNTVPVRKQAQTMSLADSLDTVFKNDQRFRLQLDSVGSFGWHTIEVTRLTTRMHTQDSADLLIVIAILDNHGWPGADIAGPNGGETIWSVLQHADLKTQEKYLPMLTAAVKAHKAKPWMLALMEDRIAIRHSRKQLYGSQVTTDPDGSYVAPLEDPDNVDVRRAAAGMKPMAQYLKDFDLTWDAAAYKIQLPALIKRESDIQYN
jgi:hypothetical protein